MTIQTTSTAEDLKMAGGNPFITAEGVHIVSSQEQMLYFFDIDKNNDTLYSAWTGALQFGGCGLCFCLKGVCELMMNDRSYTVRENDMAIFFPKTVLQIINKSDDFVACGFLSSTDFVKDLHVTSPVDIFFNPCISIPPASTRMFIQMIESLKYKMENTSHPYRKEIIELMMLMICYEIAGIYQKSKPIQVESHSRQETLFRQFLYILHSEGPVSREVAYYADRMCITPKYLSMVVKKSSGASASEWITQYTLIIAKRMLKTTDLSIQQIADKLSFPNPSFFGQYFKRNVGITPKKYRNM